MNPRFKKLKGGYVIDRWLMFFFFAPSMVVLVFGLVHGFTMGFQGVSCPSQYYEGCDNPYYGVCDDYALCGLETLPPGYAYNVPPWFLRSYMSAVLLGLAAAFFIINHRRYNRGWDFGL